MVPCLAQNAAAVLIGNELLSGKVSEANLVELARTLRTLGVNLARVVMIPDVPEVIARDVSELSARFDVVFTSGGVGPTHDDVTIEAIAAAFGVAAAVHPELSRLLEKAYGERLKQEHLRMALAPEGAELATSRDVLWPVVVMRNVWVLPGVPEIFRMKLSIVREWVRGPMPFVSRAVFTQMEEADLKPLLDRVVAGYPEVDVGSYPKWYDPTYKTKITFDARRGDLVEAALQDFLLSLPAGEPQRVE